MWLSNVRVQNHEWNELCMRLSTLMTWEHENLSYKQ